MSPRDAPSCWLPRQRYIPSRDGALYWARQNKEAIGRISGCRRSRRENDLIVNSRLASAAGQSWQQQHLTDSSSLEGGVGLGGVLQRQSPIDRNLEFARGHRVGHMEKSIGVLL